MSGNFAARFFTVFNFLIIFFVVWRRETEGDREKDGWREERRHTDDTVQQTESYGDIWRIHEAVMNLFSFFYRSARVSLMAK